MTGKVKFFNEAAGYGFITNDETGNDIFVHATSLNDGLRGLDKEAQVSYEEGEGKKGIMAVNVSVI